MGFRKIVAWIAAVLLLAGCTVEPAPAPATSRPLLTSEAPTATVPEVPPTTLPEEPPTTAPEESGETAASFANLPDLRDYLWCQAEEGNREISFRYTGPEEPEPGELARMLSALYVNLSIRQEEYTLTLWQYPGERMVDAWRGGDDSGLSEAERQTLALAREIVSETDGKSVLERERFLHDYLCDHVTYHSPSTQVDDPAAPPRHLTAVGALLDGQANCQGFTDAFYLLGTLAGLEVSRMSVWEAEQSHMCNTVRLDGAWYVVDVTYDNNDQGTQNYRLLNAGLAEIQEYTWPEEYEYHPIAQTGGDWYFYNLPADGGSLGYEKTYASLEAMAEGVVEQWHTGGYGMQYVRLKGESVPWSDLSDAIRAEAEARELGCSWYIWGMQTEQDSFFSVEFNANINE